MIIYESHLKMIIYAAGTPVPAQSGDTVLGALQRAEYAINTVCGGKAVCGTCRIAVSKGWVKNLHPPSKDEARLLNVLKGGNYSHRLACQVNLDWSFDGLTFVLDPPPNRRRLVMSNTI